MLKRSGIRLYALAGACAALLAAPATARAQFRPQPVANAATGETYHVEGAVGFWRPSANILISSESLGIPGSEIDFKQDLGLQDHAFPELHLVLRPGRHHKFRFQYIPIKFESSATLDRRIVFNGQAYNVGLPVNSTLLWKAYRFGYEYDFLVKDRGFGGFIVDLKYTDITATLASPIDTEFTHAQAPVPAIGGIARVYVVPNVSITGELSGIKIPKSDSYAGHYADLDIYATVNFNPNVGAQMGFRSFDVGYLVKSDAGTLTLRGLYFGVVARY